MSSKQVISFEEDTFTNLVGSFGISPVEALKSSKVW